MQEIETFGQITINSHWEFSIVCIFQRALFLENDSEMEVAHSAAATAGDTEVFLLIKFKF
jgi:hypothetical protein